MQALLKLHDMLPGLKIIAAYGGSHFISDKERGKLIGRRIYIENLIILVVSSRVNTTAH